MAKGMRPRPAGSPATGSAADRALPGVPANLLIQPYYRRRQPRRDQYARAGPLPAGTGRP